MTSYLIDINVWLAMTWDMHPQHANASRWYAAMDESNECAYLFCRFTMLGFLRLLSNRTVMGDSTVTVNTALKLYDQWVLDPRVELVPEPRGIDKLFRDVLASVAAQPATKAIPDCYLIGFAAAIRAHVVTLDKGLAKLAKGQRVPVTLIRSRQLN